MSVRSDLFNLALPDAWSVVLADYDRHIESGFEQRIAIDRIVMHDNYENYQHDVVLMRLARPANIQQDALARKICLPFVATSSSSGGGGSSGSASGEPLEGEEDIDAFDGSSNQLRKLQLMRNAGGGNGGGSRRRNDKFIKERSVFNRVNNDNPNDYYDRKKYVTNFNQFHFAFDKPTGTATHQQHQLPAKSKVNVSTTILRCTWHKERDSVGGALKSKQER